MIVVTGATGFLGSTLVRRLLQRMAQDAGTLPPGPVRALARKNADTSALEGLDVELFEADLRDPASLASAFQGADAVLHVAGIVSIGGHKPMELRAVNVEGTRNVIAACRDAGVKRLAYCSSVHALVEPQHGVCMDENSGLDPERAHGHYAKTKAEATQMVLAAAEQGLETVVVYPSALTGPYDFRPSHIGELIRSAVRRKLLAYVDGGYNFVDVRDVADGMIEALVRGRSGEGYILAGDEVSVWDLLHAIEEVSGVPAPRLHLNFRFVRSISFLIPAYYWVTRQKPLFTTYSLDVISSNCLMSSEKAAKELGYKARPLNETLSDAVAWFEERGMI